MKSTHCQRDVDLVPCSFRTLGTLALSIAAVVLGLLLADTQPARAETLKPGPQGDSVSDSTGKFRQQEYRIPFTREGDGPLLQALLLLPRSEGPFPLVIINHGSARRSADRAKRELYPTSSRWFATHGFAVLTLTRRGYGDSEGRYIEDYGPCSSPNYEHAIDVTANDIEAGLRYMQTRSFIDGRRVVLVGQSAGGMGVVALGARNPQGVVAVLNFAGGRGSRTDDQVCNPDALIKAMPRLGKTSRIPSLWIYSENDRYFGPQIAKGMFDSFAAVGGAGTFLPMPPFGDNGHRLFGHGSKIWGPPVGKFLDGIPELKAGR